MFRLFRRKQPRPFPGHEAPPPPGRKPWVFLRRHPAPLRSRWLYVFAFIGLMAVLFLLIRYLIVPLLVALA